MIILVYHYFSQNKTDWLTCSTAALTHHLDHLTRYCHVVPLLEGLRTLEEGGSLPSRTVAITVDDLDVSFGNLALPIFECYGVPVFAAVITGQLGKRANMAGELELSSRKDLDKMLASGIVTFGSHSRTHPKLDELNKEQLAEELISSKRIIEQIQGSCDVFVYPYGNPSVVTPDTERQLLESGYLYAMTTLSRSVVKGVDRFRIGRTNILGSPGALRFPWYYSGLVSNFIRIKKALRRQRFHSAASVGGRIGFALPVRSTVESSRSFAMPSAISKPHFDNQSRITVADQNRASVIIPCYNNAETLARAVQSALNQSLAPAEVIIVDDGSSDDTRNVAESFGSTVSYIPKHNTGPAAARNTGIRLASGAYVAFLDADDLWRPAFLEHCCRFLDGHPEAGAVSTGLFFQNANGSSSIRPSLSRSCSNTGPFIIENFFDFWAEEDHIRTGSCVVRRETLFEVGLQNEDLRVAEDLELWALLATCGDWGFIPEVLWECHSERAARARGWAIKYRLRRQNCPTLSQWEMRLSPRLRRDDLRGYRCVRGRVASALLHHQILGQNYKRAVETFKASRDDLPVNWLTTMLRFAQRAGDLGLVIAFQVVKIREIQKTLWMRLSNGSSHSSEFDVLVPSPSPPNKDTAFHALPR